MADLWYAVLPGCKQALVYRAVSCRERAWVAVNVRLRDIALKSDRVLKKAMLAAITGPRIHASDAVPKAFLKGHVSCISSEFLWEDLEQSFQRRSIQVIRGNPSTLGRDSGFFERNRHGFDKLIKLRLFERS